MFAPVSCSLAGRCSGCAWIDRPYAEQIESKSAHLVAALAHAGVALPSSGLRVTAIAAAGLRDRADLTIDARSGERRLGLYGAEGIVDLPACPALSPALEAWLREFRQVPVGVARGSVRLRVSPAGQRGAWLDFANADIKRLLDDRRDLDALRATGATIELGQKRKRLVERGERLKLDPARLEPWFETYLGADEKPAALYGPIGGFTQPGFVANRALVREARAAFAAAGAQSVVEFGSGNGNFTLPLAAAGAHAIACEIDKLACAGLERSLAEAGLAQSVEIRRGDFQAGGTARARFAGVDCVFADPPRPGLKRFIDSLADEPLASRPPNFIYVSCFAESLAIDLSRLGALGYGLASLCLVDQFPQSPHYEAIARLALDSA